jgi:hypothetical protein
MIAPPGVDVSAIRKARAVESLPNRATRLCMIDDNRRGMVMFRGAPRIVGVATSFVSCNGVRNVTFTDDDKQGFVCLALAP